MSTIRWPSPSIRWARARTTRYTQPPLGRRFQAGDLITNEVSAVWGMQVAQEDQPILLGPVPDDWQAAVGFQREVFEAGLAAMRPGTTWGAFVDRVRGHERGGAAHRRCCCTAGASATTGRCSRRAPRVTPFATCASRRATRLSGSRRSRAPTVASSFTWGGDVLVTARGGETLFARPHGLVSIE